METEKQVPVIDIKPMKGFTSKSESDVLLRVNPEKVKDNAGYDPTRTHLDFEVKDGKVVDIDSKTSIGRRIRESLKNRSINDPNEGKAKPRFRTIIDCYFSGSSFTMRELAFGNQDVNFSKGADNSKVQRQSDIEEWAIYLYIFLAEKFGEENIVIFVVHLDDATPHAHCQILPITKENKFSYRKIMVGEINSKNAYRDNMIKLQNELYDKVYKEWGFKSNTKTRMNEDKYSSIKATGYDIVCVELRNLYQSFKDLYGSSTSGQRWILNNKVYPLLNSSNISVVMNHPLEVIQIAHSLLCEDMENANRIALSCKGRTIGEWYKKKDESDFSFRKRCFVTAIDMIRTRKGSSNNTNK